MEKALDGRYIDEAIASLEGEAADQKVDLEHKTPPASEAWPLVPSRNLASAPTYYDKPAIKAPVWIWSVPAYFYTGGLAGASMAMGLAVQWFGGKKLKRFEERCRWVGAIGGGVGTALLIYDLGRKARFLNMLRVFRPTSPMSIGSWILATATPLSAGSALLTMAEGPGRRMGDWAGVGAGVLGLPLATYTAVLISNSAVPIWQGSRRTLPWLFAASSVASMASLFELMPLGRRECAIVERFGLAGRSAEIAATLAVEAEGSSVKEVSKALHEGLPGALWTAAKVLTISSLAVSLLPINRRTRRWISGTLGTLGGIALRFAVFHAGKRSARDPRATFRQQRAVMGAAEVTGRPAVTASDRELGMRQLPQPRTLEDLVPR